MYGIRESYNKQKLRYFRLLNSKRAYRGSIRAHVGASNYIYESSFKSNQDGYEVHVLAFEKTLNDLEKKMSGSKASFEDHLSSVIKEWRKCKQVHKLPGKQSLLPSPTPGVQGWHPNGFKAISLFSGAFGLDLGFLAAGFDLRFANDIDPFALETATLNLPNVPFSNEDINEVSFQDVLKCAGLNVGEVDVLLGGPPCQPFSTAGKREGLNDPRSSPLLAFIRAIKELRPKAFVMEEVTGLLSARLKHIPIADRNNRSLLPEEMPGSVWQIVLEMLGSTGYRFVYGKLNAADFGSPQVRERIVIIGLREGKPNLPERTHSSNIAEGLFKEDLMPWNTFWEAVADLPLNDTEHIGLSENTIKYIKLVPPGGHWRQLPKELIPEAMGGAYQAGGGKMGFYRRLAWDEPSPTVVTSPIQKGSMFCHPDILRALSVSEYKRIQGFPDDWHIPGGRGAKYRLIGNAVPVHLSFAIARHVLNLLSLKSDLTHNIHETKEVGHG